MSFRTIAAQREIFLLFTDIAYKDKGSSEVYTERSRLVRMTAGKKKQKKTICKIIYL